MMRHRFIFGSWVSIACLAFGAASAHAQEPPQAPHRPGQEAAKPKIDAKPGQMPEHRGSRAEVTPGPHPQPHPGGPGEHARENMEHHEVHGRDASVPPPFARFGDAGVRHRRPVLTPEQIKKRNEQLADLRAKFGNQLLERQDVRKEMGAHAWRIARLNRMRTLAVEQKNTKLVERIDKLTKKENERHDKRMERLRGGDAGAGPVMHPRPAHSANIGSKKGGQP